MGTKGLPPESLWDRTASALIQRKVYYSWPAGRIGQTRAQREALSRLRQQQRCDHPTPQSPEAPR